MHRFQYNAKKVMQVDILFCLSTITKLKKMISRRHLKRLVKQEKENIIKKI